MLCGMAMLSQSPWSVKPRLAPAGVPEATVVALPGRQSQIRTVPSSLELIRCRPSAVNCTTPTQPAPRSARCDRCDASSGLRFVILRGRVRYIGRTLCDLCAEEVLETFLVSASPAGSEPG